ncbi:MAG: YbjN domain-containing protein [Pseudomonadota bacterium]
MARRVLLRAEQEENQSSTIAVVAEGSMNDTINRLDQELLQRWLKEARVEFHECGDCDGLHLGALRGIEGVVDSRLFIERYGLLITTELEVRPMAMLPLAADLGRLNMDYPTLKIFLDVVDDATPQLVIAAVFPSKSGLSLSQCAQFVSSTCEATRKLCAECLELDFLFAEGQRAAAMPKSALH